MKEIFKLPDSLPKFFKSDVSKNVLVEFNGQQILYVVGTIDVCVVEGEIETWGFTMTTDSPITTLYSIGVYGLISISSVNGQKAIVQLANSGRTEKWKTFMNQYVPEFSIFDINRTRLTPPKSLIELEEQLDCHFDLSKTPMSNQRLIFEEQWQEFSTELIKRSSNNQSIKVLLAGYKNSGKSTMMHYLINKCLKKWDKILVLDFDIGQSEFSLPGCISAFIIDAPLLGPNFTHFIQPFKSYFFESNNVMTNVPLYIEIIEKLINDIKTNDSLFHIPCFINTMGFVEGPGLKILYNVISKTKPSDVVQVKFNDNQDLNLHSDLINDETNSSHFYDLWYFTSMVKNKLAKAPYMPHVDKHVKQNLVTTSYFSKCLKSTDIYFTDIVPYKVNVNKIDIKISNIEELTRDECFDIINANVIALCVSTDNTELCEIVGFGIVRNINKSTGDIFVVTPVTYNLLYRVNQFRLGKVLLPITFYTKGSQISKYVCVKQDNIFNENITRHYKVMS